MGQLQFWKNSPPPWVVLTALLKCCSISELSNMSTSHLPFFTMWLSLRLLIIATWGLKVYNGKIISYPQSACNPANRTLQIFLAFPTAFNMVDYLILLSCLEGAGCFKCRSIPFYLISYGPIRMNLLIIFLAFDHSDRNQFHSVPFQ